eukprot:TRINITY_DN5838_c0_g1_i1.p1 TRINITY_DN5838_c0_g1~~TRINITY_DN5838_c0_g1_i1.p1  ORF type:complete len:223 (-),score=33.33 TRINITY_DN5838_c0_g1_i1:1045-1713(-)
MDSKVNTIIFDFGGVLGTDVEYRCVFNRIHADKHDQVKHTIRKLWNKIRVDPAFTEDIFWKELIDTGCFIDQENVTVDVLKESIRKEFRVFYPTLSLAVRLQKRGYNLCVLSNHSKEWFEFFFSRYWLNEIFVNESEILGSYQVGYAKPDINIYKIMWDRIERSFQSQHLQPVNCVFIDDKKDNVETAIKFGFKGIHWSYVKNEFAVLINHLEECGVDARER